jgi:hypothetical protein
MDIKTSNRFCQIGYNIEVCDILHISVLYAPKAEIFFQKEIESYPSLPVALRVLKFFKILICL